MIRGLSDWFWSATVAFTSELGGSLWRVLMSWTPIFSFLTVFKKKSSKFDNGLRSKHTIIVIHCIVDRGTSHFSLISGNRYDIDSPLVAKTLAYIVRVFMLSRRRAA